VPDYAEWVSTLAPAVGAGNLSWQVVRARREQPIITVNGQWSVAKMSDEDWAEGYWSLPVDVTNAGGRAATVLAVFWEVGGMRVTSSRDAGPALPLRLEPLSAEAWEVKIPVRGTLWSGRTARPGADVVLGRGVVTVHGPSYVLGVPDSETGRIRRNPPGPSESSS
jgi:hypothetical protein